MFGYGNGFGCWGPFGFGGGFMGIIFLVIAVMFVFYFFKDTRSGKISHSDSALTILDERYARGEIDAEEYRKMKTELKK